MTYDDKCPKCDGTGEVHSHNSICWTCGGSGRPAVVNARSAGRRIVDTTNDDVEQEDRGMPVRIWIKGDWCSYNRWPEAESSRLISVPIGWSLFADPTYGATLRNAFGVSSAAGETLDRAKRRVDGFRLRKDAT